MIPLMSVSRNFWIGREPEAGTGPYAAIDLKKADAVTWRR